MSQDTIAAIATPHGSGGIGIVRLSGPDAIAIIKRIFKPDEKSGPSMKAFPAPRFMHLGYIMDNELEIARDEVLVCVMPGPKSYTSEDVVEIQCHGGHAVIEAVLRLVIKKGARMAGPGEFTLRAFLNGRIDLTQAEAVADLINAKSDFATQSAMRQLSGGLKDVVDDHLACLKNELAILQAIIEFPEDIDEEYNFDRLNKVLKKKLLPGARDLLKNYEKGKIFQQGICINIVGRPNVGKSSLLNRMIKREKAIVTDIPGTTRDVIEEQIMISGIPVKIMDTAGIHATDNIIEKIGIQKTEKTIEIADIVLFVLDGEQGIEETDRVIIEKIRQKRKIVVINKCDLNPGKKLPLKEGDRYTDAIWVSALTGEGIDGLENIIVETCREGTDGFNSKHIIPNFRQNTLLEEYIVCLEQSVQALIENPVEDLVAEDITQSVQILQRINGQRVDSDVLEQIFNQFCIGK